MVSTDDVELARQSAAAFKETFIKIRAEVGRMIVGQADVVDGVLTALMAGGHVLLEGVPGLGKTMLVSSISRAIDLPFSRIQFTPDMMPADIVGTTVLTEAEGGGHELTFQQGPIVSNLVLADEINRATPKTQSALLEAMQERRVTVLGESHDLPQPFFVLATQNPIELEGTYPLPEAQIDRFTFKVLVDGVDAATPAEIITTRQHGQAPDLDVVCSAAELNELFGMVDRVHLPRAVAGYIARLVSATHPANTESPEPVQQFVRFGASPRAAIALAETSRAAALLAGKPNVGFEEVQRVAQSVLGHRLILDYSARLEGWTTAQMVDLVVGAVPEMANELPEDLAG